jgi:Cu-Zn family superoxide dismutase
MRTLIILTSGLSVLLLAHPNPQATATLRDGGGRELGTLTLTDSPQGIHVTGTLNGLPDGEHAIHLHTVGRCRPAFQAAGRHWNPTGRDHGQHLGDLPNITARAGEATVSGTTPGGSLRGDQPLLDADGAAVIVHAGPDDYQSQPSGNSGDPIACGEVTE